MKTFVVPLVIQGTARKARLDHQKSPLPEEVSGVSVAEALESGRIDEQVLRRMRRFFHVQGRHFTNAAQLMHTFGNSALMRSWALHGGDGGRAWAERVYVEAQKEGMVDDDDYLTLLKATVDEVYARLSAGAWRWEYDMDPPKAARFVEEYHRATGLNLDLAKAFGQGRNAVAQAMARRAMNENPFKQLARALMRDDYRKAAKLDLREIRESIGKPAMNWPEFIGFVVLGTHCHEAIEEVLGHLPVPLYGVDRPASVFAYSPPISSYLTYFHPAGALFEQVGADSQTRIRMARLMWMVQEDEVASEVTARDSLEVARCATAKHGFAAGLGHVLLEAWRQRNWSAFLEAIPLDSPVRTPFEQVVDQGVLPS